MTARRTLLLLLAVCALACAPQRTLVRPATPSKARLDYVYFIENVEGKDSRLMKCDIRPDNGVVCAIQFDAANK
jgi:hypothetical protein